MAVVDGHIRCSSCGQAKPISCFAPSRVKSGNGRCRDCARVSAVGGKEWRRSASALELARYGNMRGAYYRKNKGKILRRARDRQLAAYGITTQEYEAILVSQGGRCACCGTAEQRGNGTLHVDHDHHTGQVRGLLCHNCNQGLGLFGDTISGLRRAVAYLERAAVAARPALRINLMAVPRG